MAVKLRHVCERCGLIAEFERAGRFRDEDYLELLHERWALERQFAAHMHHMQTKLERSRECIDELRELVNMLPDPVPDVDVVADESECPF